MVKISHETPLTLLNASRAFNDYDYALVHHFENHPNYFDFYKQSVQEGRRVILDNSIFELGTAFEPKQFAEWILKLKPTEYIVPDCLENYEQTTKQFVEWQKHYDDLPGVKIGVVQGKSYNELVKCYKFMSLCADKIAISFDYSFYSTIGLGDNKWQTFADGRYRFIKSLVVDKVWNHDKPHHLLGAAVPQEFCRYNSSWNSLNIETLDTSNPIQQGLLGHKYTEGGLPSKDALKVCDSFTSTYDPAAIEVAMHNVRVFRDLCTFK